MYIITKHFDFCYGHRVWSQELNPEFSLDSCLACRHIHGHQGHVAISLSSNELVKGMVTDFKHLNWAKKWFDDVLDHKFIMDINDPVRETLFPLTKSSPSRIFDSLFEFSKGGYYKLWPEVYLNLPKAEQEIYEGLIFVEFVPTSENLSKWIFDIVSEKMKPLGITIHSVTFNETPKSSSFYSI